MICKERGEDLDSKQCGYQKFFRSEKSNALFGTRPFVLLFVIPSVTKYQRLNNFPHFHKIPNRSCLQKVEQASVLLKSTQCITLLKGVNEIRHAASIFLN